ncbi:MAG: FapA family protein [Oscillospiraceae bacterium]|jgi:uncharacterized protein (DUF342 family)|nr:FapA family protein [Oscillospiraceae bacterium]
MRGFRKFISGEDYSAAVKAAAEYFGCGENDIIAEAPGGGDTASPCLILAVCDKDGKIGRSFMPGGYSLYYEEDGVYLELYPHRGEGKKLNTEETGEYCRRKSLSGLDSPALRGLLGVGSGRARIAPAQKEVILDEDIAVYITRNAMSASIRFLPAEEGGNMLTLGAVKEKLAAAGVLFGADYEAIARLLENKEYGVEYDIASGTEPEDGKDGYIEYHFRLITTGAPKDIGKGRVDLRELDLFERVSKGQLLVTRHPPTLGEPGFTVKNEMKPPKRGRAEAIPRGKNVVTNEEKTQMYSAKDGMVNFENRVVTVSDVYVVKGDCDMGVGNIDFDGSIIINGAVMGGMTIRAKNNIVIGGVVEGAKIIAGGDVELKRGILGMDRGLISAEGSVIAQFIERAAVRAGISVRSDTIVHSNVEAGGTVSALGKRGSIIGGTVRACGEIRAQYIGAASHTQTNVEIGIPQQKRDRISFLQGSIKKANEETAKLGSIIAYFNSDKGKADSQNAEKKASVIMSIEQNAKIMEEYSEELYELENEAAKLNSGKIHVSNTLYPGVRIIIGGLVRSFETELQYSTIKYGDGEIVFGACEV